MKKILVFLILFYVNCFAQLDFPFAAMYGGDTTLQPGSKLTLDSAYAATDTEVVLTFSQSVEEITSETTSNYLITSGEGGSSQAKRIWIDTDTDNEIDDYFAILRFFVDSSVVIEGLSSSHHGIAGSADITANQSGNGDMLSQIGWTSDIIAPQGQSDALVNATTYTQSDACDSIIAAAHRGSASNKLTVFCGGSFSNVASAILKDPTIVPKITISLMGYNYNSSILQANDFNAFNDVNASTAIMDSGVEIIVMPANPVSSQLIFAKADAQSHLQGNGTVWDYVYQTWIDKFNGYSTRTLWDIAGVEALLDTNLATWDYNVSFGSRSDLTVASDIDQAAMVLRYWAAIDAGIAGTRAKVISELSTADTINVVSAVRLPDSVVTLTTGTHNTSIAYLVQVSNVKNLNNNIIASPNDTASYVYTAPIPPDTIPDAFVFTDVIDATLSTEYISNTIALSGFDSAYASFSGTGSYVVNDGSYGTSTIKVFAGDSIKVKLTSSGSNSTALTGTVTVGGFSDGYSVTTESAGVTYALEDDFSDGDYTANPVWTTQSGAFWEVNDTVAHAWKTNDYALVPLSLNARISVPCTTAYGTWIFDFWLDAGTYDISPMFIGTTTGDWQTNQGYLLSLQGNNAIGIYRTDGVGGATKVFETASNYFVDETWYSLKIERNLSGEFTISIMGGAFGTGSWTNVTASVGANPFTDNAYTVSNYFEVSMDNESRITNISVEE